MSVRTLAVFLCLITIEVKAQAQTYLWVEPQVAVEKEESKVVGGENFTTISFGHQWRPWLGVFAQTSHGNFWGETVIGPSFALTKKLQVGVGVGIEHFEPRPLRLRANAYYDDERTGSFAYIQIDTDKQGKSSWVWADATYMFGSVGIGGLLQMPDAGVGPKLELRVGKHVGFWVSPVYDWQTKKVRTLIGGRLMFDR